MRRMIPGLMALLVGAPGLLPALPAAATSHQAAPIAGGKTVRGEPVRPAVQSTALEKQSQQMLAPQGIALLTLRPLLRPAERTQLSRR